MCDLLPPPPPLLLPLLLGDINETLFREMADAIEARGLKDVGYIYVNLYVVVVVVVEVVVVV